MGEPAASRALGAGGIARELYGGQVIPRVRELLG